jgi:4-amino-4-deoxy-L-arabinose transferase-like glycosyltransferase
MRPDRVRPGVPAPAQWARSDTRRLLAVTAAAFVLFTYGLGVGTLWDQDEPRYAEVAQGVLQSRELFTLRLEGQPWFVHPPLFMWLQAATAGLFGLTEFTARFWSAASGAGIVAVTFLLGRLLGGSATGALAAVITATTLQVLAQSRLAVFDPTLLVFMLAAFYMYMVAYVGGGPNESSPARSAATRRSATRRAHLWAWAWAGLATATKGPIGLALPAMVVVALWAVRREWTRWREIPWIAPFVFAVLGLPWYVIETVRYGAAFLKVAVGYYLFRRFFGVVENQPGPWWYYAPVLLLGTFPWTAFIPSTISWMIATRRELLSQVVLLWCGLTVGFYTLAGTKLPNYVLPVYPVLAIGIAHTWRTLLAADRDATRLRRMTVALLPIPSAIFIAAVVAYGRLKYPAESAWVWIPVAAFVAVFAAGPIIALALIALRRQALAVAAIAAACALAVPILVHYTIPAVERQRPIPRLARYVRGQMRAGDGLAAIRMEQAQSLRYYSGQRVIWVDGRDDLTAAVCSHDRVFVVVSVADDEAWVATSLAQSQRLQEDAGLRVRVVERSAACTGG